MPLTAYPPTAEELSPPGGAEPGTKSFDRNVAVRGGLSIGRDVIVHGTFAASGSVDLGNSTFGADGYISTKSITLTQIDAPAAPTVTPKTAGGGQTYTYLVVARMANNLTTQAGPTASTADGAANLATADSYNTITWTAVTGAYAYDVYRTATVLPNTTGKITAEPVIGTSFVDNGYAGDTSVAPTVNETGAVNAVREFLRGDHGELVRYGSVTELVTIAAAATTTSAADLLPANSMILSVVGRVTTLIPTAATFKVGVAGLDTRFATGILVAAGTTFVGLTHHGVASPNGVQQVAAAKILVTPNLQPGDATGRLRLTVFYKQFVPPSA
jgi:hypothetical protein